MDRVIEYSGQFIGGPDDGNMVTSSVARIPVEDTTIWYLDGKNGEATIRVVRGEYIWDENKNYFKWFLHGASFNPERASV